MIGLDTNVLVRYLAQDDPAQSARANEIIERHLTDENPGFVSLIAMVETVWVLERSYGLSDLELAAVVERIIGSEHLVVQHEQAVFGGMLALKQGRGSFSDAVIAHLGIEAGCRHSLTFDRRTRRLPGFAAA